MATKSLSAKNENLVSALTSYLRGLARRRNAGTVTADDANKYLSTKGVSGGSSKKIRTRQAVINAAFLGGDFLPAGTVQSSRPAAKGRSITEWMIAS